MLLCDATFVPKAPDARDALDDAVVMLMGALACNGQVWGEEVRGWIGTTLRVTFNVPRVDALERRHHSDVVLRRLDEVDALCERIAFHVHPMPGRVDDSYDWSDDTALYLYTHFFDRTSPVVRGRDGAPVPLYLLPLTHAQREALVRWMREYRALDEVWLDSGDLEMAAYEQLASPRTALSSKGRALAAAVESATGLPTYYYLMRYRGRRQREEDRPCPACKKPWRTGSGTGQFGGIDDFHFRCDGCRWLTNLPDDPG